MGKISNDILFNIIFNTGGSGGGGGGEGNQFLPDPNVYTYYKPDMTAPEDYRWNFMSENNATVMFPDGTTDIAVDDKICVIDVVLPNDMTIPDEPFAVWGTVVNVASTMFGTMVTINPDGATTRLNGVHTRTVSGDTNVFGVSKVSVTNDYLPDKSVYTEFKSKANMTTARLDNMGQVGASVQVYVVNLTNLSVNQKVLFTGTCSDSSTKKYAVWGTITSMSSSTAANKYVYLTVDGATCKTGTNDAKSITANGSNNVFGRSKVTVNVPNSYSTSDNGKVVSNRALVSQTSKNITANGTYDTTTNNQVVVNVPNPSTGVLTITENGTYDVSGYASVTVNISDDSLGPDNTDIDDIPELEP